jgi:hypothetical protein
MVDEELPAFRISITTPKLMNKNRFQNESKERTGRKNQTKIVFCAF